MELVFFSVSNLLWQQLKQINDCVFQAPAVSQVSKVYYTLDLLHMIHQQLDLFRKEIMFLSVSHLQQTLTG